MTSFSPSVCVAIVALLIGEMAAQTFAYHAHGTADSDKILLLPMVCVPCRNIKLALLTQARP